MNLDENIIYKWYLAEHVIEIIISCEEQNIVHKNLVLISAGSAEEAYEKALFFGKQKQTMYKNTKGQQVQHHFRGISKLEEMYDEIRDGCELRFDEHCGVSPDEIKQWVLPKKDLQVFLPVKPFEDYNSLDYSSAEVIKKACDSKE